LGDDLVHFTSAFLCTLLSSLLGPVLQEQCPVIMVHLF